MYTDIAIIGGGASGFAAAITVARFCSGKVTIFEKLARTGKKIIATGNGKCNLSNESLKPENYHGSVDAMKIINNTPDWYKFFTEGMGVVCVSGSEGRTGGIYPKSNTATTILNALRLTAESLGINEICDFEVTGISGENNNYIISSKNGTVACRKIIVASGGYAGTSFGTDGAVMRIFKDMGYRISKICPAVAPLKVSPDKLKGLKGVRVKGSISAVSGNKVLRTEYGEMHFNENNVSGICVFNMAYLFQEYEGKMTLRADLLPDMTINNITEYIRHIKKIRSGNCLEETLTGVFPKNLAVYLVRNTLERPLTDSIETLKDCEIKKIADVIKCLEFEVTGCSSWQNAQATCGGIYTECITGNLESKKHKGIYFCGEILDTVGDCGGYNLQWAWSSGIWAGMHCAESLKGGGKC